MDIKSFFNLDRFCRANSRLSKWEGDPFDRYYDKHAQVFCLGNIPVQIKQEACSIIEGKFGRGARFNREYVDSLGLSASSRKIFDDAFSQLLFWVSKLVVFKPRKKGQLLYPWQYAVIIVPSLNFNAWVSLSFDEKENTALIFLNIGVLFENLDRLHASFSTPGFLASLLRGENPGEEVFVPKQGRLCNLSENADFRAIATDMSIKASMMVVFHEFAHFFRGHVCYLRGKPEHSGEVHEAPVPDAEAALDDTLRRIIEFDADQLAGVLASQFWRLFDHPVVSPEEDRNEAFLTAIVAAVISNNLILGQYGFTDRYYSPAWRVQHTLEMFYSDYFGVGKKLFPMVNQARRQKVSAQLHDFQLAWIAEFERAYRMLGLGGGLSYQRVGVENITLLGSDCLEHKRLQLEFKKYMPAHFHYPRPIGQAQY